MVYILNELYYEGKTVGYRCIVFQNGDRHTKGVVDISLDEYKYLHDKYGKMYYLGMYEGKQPPVEIMHLNKRGYLETGYEGKDYLRVDGLAVVEDEIRKQVWEDIVAMKNDAGIVKQFKLKYDEFNAKYFYNKLPQSMRIVLNRRYTSTGATFSYFCREPYRNKISISKKYMETYPEVIEDTLIHEMIHAYMYELGYLKEGHGARFKAEMARINRMGRKVTRYTVGDFSVPQYKYLVQCKGCGEYYKYKRRLKYNLSEYTCRCGADLKYVYKEPFYKAYLCENCGTMFFEGDKEDIKDVQYCPCCNTVLKEV